MAERCNGICRTCAFYHPHLTNIRSSVVASDMQGRPYFTGECRRQPPVMLRGDEYGNGLGEGVWPAVRAIDWCGEFQPDAEAGRG